MPPTPSRSANLTLPQTLLAGALTGLALAVVQLIAFLGVERALLDGVERAAYFGALATLLGAAGVLAAAVFFALAWAISALDRFAGARGVAQRLFCATLGALVGGSLAYFAFTGEKARRMADRQVWQGAIVTALFVAGVLAPWAWQRAFCKPRAFILTALAACVALTYADTHVLYRLYSFAHVYLEALVALAVFVAFAIIAARAKVRPSLGGALVAIAIAAYVFALPRVTSSAAVRAALATPTGLGAPLFIAWSARHVRALPVKKIAPPLAQAAPPTHVAPDLALGSANVIIITLDAMRADRLRPDLCPTLWQLAHDGVNFTHAYAPVPHTSFSVASLLTGKNMYSLSELGIAAADHETLPQLLRKERYKTAGFYPPAIFYIDHDKLHDFEKDSYGFEYVKYEYSPAPERTDQLIAYFENEKPKRAFVWVHYFEPHEPYELHGQADRSLTAMQRYEGEIRFVDAEVARLIAYLRKTRPRTLVVIAADHGEEFGEHGGRYHGTTLYEEQVRVPLAFSFLDRGVITPRDESRPVSLVDVAPTILASLGIDVPADMRGTNLSPLLRDAHADVPSVPVVAEINREKMVTDGAHKLVCDFDADGCRYFDLAHDPEERRASNDDPSVLRAYLDNWVDAQSRYQASLSDGAVSQAVAARNVAALPALVTELSDPARDARLRAARALGQFFAVSATRDQVAQMARARVVAHDAKDDELARWLALAEAVAGGEETALATAASSACATSSEWCARAGLRLDDVELLLPALDFAAQKNEIDLEERVATALGHSHDGRAYASLLEHLGDVRPRLKILLALGELGDARAIPTLARWLPADPYVPVRAAMADVLVVLAKRGSAKDRALVLATLQSALREETEAEVMRELARGTTALAPKALLPAVGKRLLVEGGSARRQCWLFGDAHLDANATLDVDGTATPIAIKGGVGAWSGDARAVRLTSGAGARNAYCRVEPTESATQAK